MKLDTANFFLPASATDPFGETYRVEYDDYSLLIKATVDPLGNRVEVMNDYRVLAPKEITDPNLNRSAVGFDALGMVIWIAVMGSPVIPVRMRPCTASTEFKTRAAVDPDPIAPLTAVME